MIDIIRLILELPINPIMETKNMKVKYSLICALSLNFALAGTINAKEIEDIAKDRVDIQKIYNLYNNELAPENSSLMSALDSFADNAKKCVLDFNNNIDSKINLGKSIDNFDRTFTAFEMSYKDIKANYDRQVKNLALLNKVKELDADRVQYARNLLKNLNLTDASDLNRVRQIEQRLNNVESSSAFLFKNLATASTEFSLVKPQIDGIEASMKNLSVFFKEAKMGLEASQKTLDKFEPKVKELYDEYQKYLDVSIADYNESSILAEDILAKTLESFYDIKDSFAFTNAQDFVFESYKNLSLTGLRKPNDMTKAKIARRALDEMNIGMTDVNILGVKGVSDRFSSSPAGYTARKVSVENTQEKMIKELMIVNSIIDDLNTNYYAQNAVLNNIKTLSNTIKRMSETSVELLKASLTLSTDSQVLLTNVEIFKGELEIKSKQAEISVDNMKNSLDKIKSSKNKIKELL